MSAQNEGPGVLALLDVLGAGTRDVGRARELARKLDRAAKQAYAFHQAQKRVVGTKPARVQRQYKEPTFRAFQDTLMLYWPMSENPYMTLVSAAASLKQILVSGLVEHLPFRGAVAVGEIVPHASGLFGPAATDAAEWHGEAEALGVIASPSMGLLMESLSETDRVGLVPRHFVRYPTETKRLPHGTEVWTLSWPDSWMELGPRVWNHIRKGGARAALTWALHDFDVPAIAAGKYTKTLAFFDWYVVKYLGEPLAGTEEPDHA
jgi:hypothetical protein